MPAAAFDYSPRHPESSVLYGVIAAELETFLAAREERGSGRVLNVFVHAVFGELRRRAKETFGLKSSQCGAATFIQRFNDALNVAPHFHSILIDGVYAADEAGKPDFYELPPPEDADVLWVVTQVAERVEALFKRRRLHPDDNPDDELSRDEPGLAAIYSASVRSRVAVGPNTGNRVVTLGDRIDGDALEAVRTPRCASLRGFSLHANCAIGPHDRLRLERLVRYAARPAIASERLSELPDGRLLYRLKRRWSNGTTEVVFDRQDFIAKLAALVPAPRAHLRTYHGILGPAAKWRPLIIPEPEVLLGPCLQIPNSSQLAPDLSKTAPQAPLKKNYSWAQLLQRVFDIDISACELCGGPVRIIAVIETPKTVEKILNHLGLPARPPPTDRPHYEAILTFNDFIS